MARNSAALPMTKIEEPRAACSWEGCQQRAVVREEIEPGKGRHNLCEFHYVQACHKASERRVRDELGLHSIEEMKAYCRRKVKTVFRSVRRRDQTLVVREPGQDDEERIANSELRVSNASR